MLVSEVKAILLKLRAVSPPVKAFDLTYVAAIESRFRGKKESNALTPEDLVFLRTIFEQRWSIVLDTAEDYCFNIHGANEYWIALAKTLASTLHLSIAQILIPTAKNTIDPLGFSKISDCEDLRGLLLGDDNKTLYRVRELFRETKFKSNFFTYSSIKNIEPRPLTMVELLRLRRKKEEGLEFEVNGVTYRHYWDYLKRVHMLPWSTQGECPISLLPPILEIARLLTSETWDESHSRQLLQMIKGVSVQCAHLPVRDVNHLYSQVIKINTDSYYLVDILLDCFYNKVEHRQEKARGILKWLANLNPSLVVTSPKLESLYAELNLGQSLRPSHLKPLFELMKKLASKPILAKLKSLIGRAGPSERFNASLVTQIKQLYELRWAEIKDTPMDYLRGQHVVHTPWIRCAQMLIGAQHFTSVYGLLIPSLKKFEDPITLEDIASYPLSHFILSETEEELILLENSVKRYREYRTFYNCNVFPAVPFTHKEQERLQFSHHQYRKYAQILRVKIVDAPLSSTTIRAVKALVEGSLYPEGLLFGMDYHQTKMAAAFQAYVQFSEFYHRLSEKERHHLNQQHILFHGRDITFVEILRKVQADECIAIYGQYLAQMVIDYWPYERFRPELEARAYIEDMRAQSKHKYTGEYAALSEPIAMRRLQLLAVSILTRTFYYLPFTGQDIKLWDMHHWGIPIAAELMNLILPTLVSGRASEARFKLGEIKFRIQQELKDDSWLASFLRYQDTLLWLNSIVNDSFFERSNLWFDPQVIFIHLVHFADQQKATQKWVFPLLDSLILTLSQDQNPYLVEIRANVKIQEWLAERTAEEMVLLKSKLGVDLNPKMPVITIEVALKKYIKCRLEGALNTLSRGKMTFFSAGSKGSDALKISEAPKFEAGQSINHSIQNVVSWAYGIILKTKISASDKLSLTQYLTELHATIGLELPIEHLVHHSALALRS